MIARGKAKAEACLSVLNDHMLGDGRPWLCGADITLADYLGSGIITLGDIIGCDFARWPNVRAWLARLKTRPNWQPTNGAIQGWAEMARGQTYVTL